MIGTFSHIFIGSIMALRKARMLKIAKTPTQKQMVHIYHHLLYSLYPSLCKSWFPARNRYSVNYSTLLKHFPSATPKCSIRLDSKPVVSAEST